MRRTAHYAPDDREEDCTAADDVGQVQRIAPRDPSLPAVNRQPLANAANAKAFSRMVCHVTADRFGFSILSRSTVRTAGILCTRHGAELSALLCTVEHSAHYCVTVAAGPVSTAWQSNATQRNATQRKANRAAVCDGIDSPVTHR